MLKTYPDETAYEAAEKSKIESSVALIESTGRAVFDGVNVVTDNPGVGDIVCYDENRKIRFIALDTFQAGTFPSAWETVGVVVLRKGNRVTVCSKHSELHKFMDVYPYIVTGYQLDGQEHTVQLRVGSQPSGSYYDFAYTASTDEEFVSALNGFLAEHGFTGWSSYIRNGKVILQCNVGNSDPAMSLACVGLTKTSVTTETFLPKGDDVYRKCGTYSMTGVWHLSKAMDYFKSDIDNTDFNPGYNIASIPKLPVCYPAFCGTSQYQDDHCRWLREKYCKDAENPTFEDWKGYLEDMRAVVPFMVGFMSPADYPDAKTVSEKARRVTFITQEGTEERLYPGMEECCRFLDGAGYLPTAGQLAEAFREIIYGLKGVERDKADPINRSLYAIGGNPVSCSLCYWSSDFNSRFSFLNIFLTGMLGYYNQQSAWQKGRFLPFADIDLSELTD